MQFVTILISSTLFLNVGHAQIKHLDTTFTCDQIKVRVQSKQITEMQSELIFTKDNTESFIVDTIYISGISDFEIFDFNNDHFPDFGFSYIGNIPITFVYLYDSITKIHRKVFEIERFPSSIQLYSNPRLFYSYHRNGCADANWVSNLYKIENFHAVLLGEIQGNGCDDLNEPFVEITKITEKPLVIERHPYSAYFSDTDDKLSFIEKYWNAHYHLFE